MALVWPQRGIPKVQPPEPSLPVWVMQEPPKALPAVQELQARPESQWLVVAQTERLKALGPPLLPERQVQRTRQAREIPRRQEPQAWARPKWSAAPVAIRRDKDFPVLHSRHAPVWP